MVKGKLNEEKRLEIVYKMVFYVIHNVYENNTVLTTTFSYYYRNIAVNSLMYELLDLKDKI